MAASAPGKKTSLSAQTRISLLWSSIDHFSLQGMSCLFGIILARMLSPKEYGILGMLTIFLAISQSVIDSGFSQALIRKQNRTAMDLSTVFYFNVAVSIGMYALCFFLAPPASRFFSEPVLVPLLRFMSLSFIVNSLAVVQRALFIAGLDFKTQTKISVLATLAGGSVGVLLAWNGKGVWALAWQQMTACVCTVSLLWLFSSWRPIFAFSKTAFSELFSFGSRLLLSGLIDTIYNNIRPLVIARYFTAADLGFYTKATEFANFPSLSLTGILQRVTYPVLCRLQNDDIKLAENYRRLLRLSGFVIFPLMMLLAAVAMPLITSVLGEKWTFSAEILTVLCFSMMWYPVHAINLNLLQVKGRSDLFLKLEIIKKIIGAVILALSVYTGIKFSSPRAGILIICYGGIIAGFIALFINTYYTGILIRVGFMTQMKDLFPAFLLSLLLFVLISGTRPYLPVASETLKMLLEIPIGILFFLGSACLLRCPELHEIRTFLKK